MTVSNNYAPDVSLGNNVTTVYTGNWKVFNSAFFRLYYQDVTTGVQTLKTLGIDYTLTFDPNSAGYSITLAAPATAQNQVIRARQIDLTQTTPYRTSKGFQGQTEENSFDKITSICQDLQDQVGRSVKFQLGSTAVGLIKGTIVDQAVLMASGVGGDIVFGPTAGQISGAAASAAAAAASANAAAASAATIGGFDLSGAQAANDLITWSTGLAKYVRTSFANFITLLNSTILTPQVNSINGGALAGFRNVLINPRFQIDQRRAGGVQIITTTPTYPTVDRWFAFCGAATSFNMQQISSGAAAQNNGVQISRINGNANATYCYVGQTVESANIRDWAGKQVTLSFTAAAGANFSATSGQMQIILRTGTAVDEGSSVGVQALWTGSTDAINTTQVLTLGGARQRYSFSTALGANTRELMVLFGWSATGVAGAADLLQIYDAQLEVGGVATPIEIRPYGTELQLCERYYEKSYEIGDIAGNTTLNGIVQFVSRAADQNDRPMIFFKTRKRTIPTMTVLAPQSGAANFIRNVSVGSDLSASINVQSSSNSAVAPTANTTSGSRYGFHWLAEAEL